MTRNEIINAFECCIKYHCHKCPARCMSDCITVTMQEAINLIKLQAGDIERLREREKTFAKSFYVDGIKDFASRLKEHYPHSYSVVKRIDDIMNEMVGE